MAVESFTVQLERVQAAIAKIEHSPVGGDPTTHLGVYRVDTRPKVDCLAPWSILRFTSREPQVEIPTTHGAEAAEAGRGEDERQIIGQQHRGIIPVLAVDIWTRIYRRAPRPFSRCAFDTPDVLPAISARNIGGDEEHFQIV